MVQVLAPPLVYIQVQVLLLSTFFVPPLTCKVFFYSGGFPFCSYQTLSLSGLFLLVWEHTQYLCKVPSNTSPTTHTLLVRRTVCNQPTSTTLEDIMQQEDSSTIRTKIIYYWPKSAHQNQHKHSFNWFSSNLSVVFHFLYVNMEISFSLYPMIAWSTNSGYSIMCAHAHFFFYLAASIGEGIIDILLQVYLSRYYQRGTTSYVDPSHYFY